MTLPASGAITLAQIATELGRAGTSVSLNQADVAALAGKTTSQAITIPNDFWGKSNSDYVPNALNWESMDFNATTSQTIGGVNPSITLAFNTFNFTMPDPWGYQSLFISVNKNGTKTIIYNNSTATGNTISVANGDVINFTAAIQKLSNKTEFRATITWNVVNVSNGNTVLDSVDMNLYDGSIIV